MLAIIVDKKDFSPALAILTDHGYVKTHNLRKRIETDGNISMEETGNVVLTLTRARPGRSVRNYNEKEVIEELKAANIEYT